MYMKKVRMVINHNIMTGRRLISYVVKVSQNIYLSKDGDIMLRKKLFVFFNIDPLTFDCFLPCGDFVVKFNSL